MLGRKRPHGGRARRGLKRCLEAVGFILAEFELKPSHGDPIRAKPAALGRMTCVGIYGIWLFGATLHHFCSKSLGWSTSPSLLLQKHVLEQHSITFHPKACFGATLHHFWSKILLWSNTPSLLEHKLVLEQLFWSKSLFWSNASSLLEQKLVLEQHSTTFGEKHVLEQPSITFGAKYCFGATLHHFLSKRLFWSNAPSLLVQKLVLEQHSIAFQTKTKMR